MRKIFCMPVFWLFISTSVYASCSSEEMTPDNGDGEKTGETSQEWKEVWSDDFNYSNSTLDSYWNADNGAAGHIDCSRWRENVTVADGFLYLNNKKENKGGKQWTSGSIWTKKKFKYGRFECRYKYANATGVNNSFWIFLQNVFEIDINEGKYPNNIDMAVHDWATKIEYADGTTGHPTCPERYLAGDTKKTKPGYSFPLEKSIRTRKIRLVSEENNHFQLKELRVFPPSDKEYPAPLSDTQQQASSLTNYAKSAKVAASGCLQGSGDQVRPYDEVKPENAIDGTIKTAWITQTIGVKQLILEWDEDINVGCIQLVNGWIDGKGEWQSLVPSFKIEYWDGKDWVKAVDYNYTPTVDLSKDFHTYALEWSKEELIWFFDGKEIRRYPNKYCHKEAAVYLSGAIADWVGTVTDQIDGTSMIVDWVKVYQKQ